VSPDSSRRSDAAVVDALLMASRALVAVAAHSIAAVDDEVTLPEYRALVVLATLGPQNLGGLSAHLGVHPSTGTRLCDRLVVKRLIDRREAADRREVTIELTPAGERVFATVTELRRREFVAIVDRVPVEDRPGLVAAFRTFAEAAGAVPEHARVLGWS
jgi:DNA-binding MarR family transcriptional regulator